MTLNQTRTAYELPDDEWEFLPSNDDVCGGPIIIKNKSSLKIFHILSDGSIELVSE